MIFLLKMSLVSGFGVNPSYGARVLVLWVDLGSIGGWIRVFHGFVEGLILDSSLTETLEVSGSSWSLVKLSRDPYGVLVWLYLEP